MTRLTGASGDPAPLAPHDECACAMLAIASAPIPINALDADLLRILSLALMLFHTHTTEGSSLRRVRPAAAAAGGGLCGVVSEEWRFMKLNGWWWCLVDVGGSMRSGELHVGGI